MKKNIFIITSCALVLAACSDTDSIKKDIQNSSDEAIGFETFTTKLTRAENSSAGLNGNLEDYNTTFKVWGSKYVRNSAVTDPTAANYYTETPVFGFEDGATPAYPGQTVTFGTPTANEWNYSPKRFWDKSATKYDFYAASPATPSWVWDNVNKKLSLADFIISGTNMAEANPSTSVIANKVMATNNTEDLMISTDITEHKTYTTQPVQLNFNHILSRLNIGVRKGTVLEDAAFTVKLNSIKIYNMVKKGTFNEDGATVGSSLQNATTARWTKSTTVTDKFTGTTPMQFAPSTALTITSSVTSNNYQYVYEGLVIPQQVAYKQTATAEEYAAETDATAKANMFLLDGTNAKSAGAADDSAPYLVIDYQIEQTGFTDRFVYYYNLADIFNGNGGTSAIDFNEGWQNNLMITLNPATIEFDAQVYEWATDKDIEIDIPDEAPANNP